MPRTNGLVLLWTVLSSYRGEYITAEYELPALFPLLLSNKDTLLSKWECIEVTVERAQSETISARAGKSALVLHCPGLRPRQKRPSASFLFAFIHHSTPSSR